ERKSASEFSPYWLGSSAVRTASVSGRRPGGRGRSVMNGPDVRSTEIGQCEARGIFANFLDPRAVAVHAHDGVGVDVARDVDAVEARSVEAVDRPVGSARPGGLGHGALHAFDVLVDQCVAAD